MTGHPEGDYDYVVSAAGYTTQTGTVTIACGFSALLFLQLCLSSPKPTVTLTDPAGNVITLTRVATCPPTPDGGLYAGSHSYSDAHPDLAGGPTYGCAQFQGIADPTGLSFLYSCGFFTVLFPSFRVESTPPTCLSRANDCQGFLGSIDYIQAEEGGDYGNSRCLPIRASFAFGTGAGTCLTVLPFGPAITDDILIPILFSGGGGGGGGVWTVEE
jgi:hypothetical protein